MQQVSTDKHQNSILATHNKNEYLWIFSVAITNISRSAGALLQLNYFIPDTLLQKPISLFFLSIYDVLKLPFMKQM